MKKAILILFTRLLLGIIFFWQGFGKVYHWGIDNVYKTGFKSFEDQLPVVLLKITAYATSCIELISGILLVLGLFRKYTYIAIGILLLAVSFGHGLESPIWDLSHVFYRSMLLLFIAWFYQEDVYHTDRFFVKK